jgi:hypothetical protein
MVGLNGSLGLNAIENAAAVGQRHLGWDIARAEREVADYRAAAHRFRPGRVEAAIT